MYIRGLSLRWNVSGDRCAATRCDSHPAYSAYVLTRSVPSASSNAPAQRMFVSIAGMSCASCVAHVSKAARSMPGVADVTVNLSRGRATVDFDPAETSPEKIAKGITEKSGYEAKVESVADESRQADDHQQATNRWLRRAIAGLILWLPVELAHWILQLSFQHSQSAHAAMQWVALITSTAALFYVGSSFYKSAWTALLHRTTNMDTLIAMGSSVAYLYSLVYFVGGQIHLWPMPTGDELYFMESSALLALISLGHWLEANARRSAGSAIRELMNLAPAVALRIEENQVEHRTSNIEHSTSSEESSLQSSMLDVERSNLDFSSLREVPVSQINLRDKLVLRPGDRVPVDGIVTDGNSSIDESMITGEPLPVTRTVGDKVIAGTLNVDGRLIIRATAVGADTALSHIVAMVEKAQDSRPPVQKLADQISAVFVPSVLGIALLTGIGWWLWGVGHHWATAIVLAQIAKTTCSVLLIACPCALGLAVPAAIMVGTGLGARRGILIRDIDALQAAEKIDTIVFDKTGTITEGKPIVTSVIGKDMDAGIVLRIAAAAEQFSSHPIAMAILAEAKKRSIEIPQPEQFKNHAGFGVEAELDGRRFLVGNQAMMDRCGSGVLRSDDAHAPQPSGTIVYIAEQLPEHLIPIGQIEISDSVKSDSKSAIGRLRDLGIHLVMLTGDNRTAAAAIGAQVGITEIHADVRPEGKAAVIQKLQSLAAKGPVVLPQASVHATRGRADGFGRVAMVGDGINDAPALATADLGIALGSGSDVAKETGDIVLVGGSLAGVSASIVLSRATMRTIRQNLFLAFIYNVLAIPLAAAGVMHPVVAAAAMALSDITVLGNSLRLRWVRISA
jgi:Cu+-exporting ATPase